MKNVWIAWMRKLQNYLTRWTMPSTEELVLQLVLNTARLELSKGNNEYVELAPIQGCCGPFKLSGNGLPVFEYTVFDPCKDPFMMEFVKIRVEVSRPDRIHYTAHIESKQTADSKRHGEAVEMKEKYKEPFQKLALHLFRYFPIYCRERDVKHEGMIEHRKAST